jgi:hypothetical protein
MKAVGLAERDPRSAIQNLDQALDLLDRSATEPQGHRT